MVWLWWCGYHLPVQYVCFNVLVNMTAVAGSSGGSRFLYTAAVLRNTLRSTTLSDKLLSTLVFKKLSFSRTGGGGSLLCSQMAKVYKFSFRHWTHFSESVLILAHIPNCQRKKEELIAYISKVDNWPVKKNELVNKYLKQFINFTNSINYGNL